MARILTPYFKVLVAADRRSDEGRAIEEVVRMRTRISDEGNSVGDVTGFALRLVGSLIKTLRLITDNV